MMKKLSMLTVILILLTLVHNSCSTVRIPRPRGVSIAAASLYQDSDAGTFLCFDNSKTIKFSQVNDDYCDCPDGSDEPGTAACSNGKFHCTNLGYKPKNIPSSRVNDGICDCCDTSDEYKSENHCTNTCSELGEEEQKLRQSQEQLFKNGAAIRAEMISKGRQLRGQRDKRLTELKQRKAEQELIKAEKEELKKSAEAVESEALEVYKEQQREEEEAQKTEGESDSNWAEAHQTFIKFDTNKDGFVEITELQVDITLDKDRDGVVTVEEAKFFLDERDRIDLDAFVTLSWPRIKPYIMLGQGLFKPPESVEGANEEGVEEKGTTSEEEQPKAQVESEELENHEDFETDDNYEEDEEADVGEGSVVEEPKYKPEYDPDTQRLIELANEARNAFSEIEREIRETENEMKDIEDQSSKDYGVDEEFASLDGECFTFEDREYVYKLCLFDRASQQQRSGGAETTLGRWDQWIGDSNNKYSKQKYSHGASCWNGPQRSVVVELKCALEHKLISVAEPNRCEYFFMFETPASCGDPTGGSSEDANIHDEL